MAFDGIVIRALAEELNERLYLAKIEKIYQPQRDELVIFFHTPKGKIKLYGSSSGSRPGVFITKKNYKNPTVPGNFCMFLRKHITGGRVTDVRQYQTERIIEIDLETRDEMGFGLNKKLVFEIMGKHSNISLVDTKSGLILEAIKHLPPDMNSVRDVLPGRPYTYPPDMGKIPFTEIDGEKMTRIWADETAGTEISDRMVSAIQGISPLVARELSCALSPEECARTLSAIVSSGEESFSPKVYISQGKPRDIHVIPIHEYSGSCQEKEFPDVSSALEWYYDHKESANRMKQISSSLTKSTNSCLKKLRLKKQRLCDDILEAENADRYRLYGELITANIHGIEPGSEKVSLTNYYDGGNVEIILDKKLSPSKNAQQYFKKYTKAKRAIKEKNIQLKETEKDIEYLESISHYIQSAGNESQLEAIRQELYESGFIRSRNSKKQNKNKSVFEPYPFKTSTGLDVLAGRNNRENDYLTFKLAGKNDIWLHVKDMPGSHVILFANNRDVDDVSLAEAASIAAYYSKARSSGNVPVDYTKVRYVKKPNGAKPGMVIFTNNKTLYVDPDRPSAIDS